MIIFYAPKIIFSVYLFGMNDFNAKNIKISKETHELLKLYCDKRGLKIYKFLDNLIKEKCTEKKDIYGEN